MRRLAATRFSIPSISPPGDEVLVTDHGYAAVRNAAEYVAVRTGAKIVEAKVSYPITSSKIILDAVASHNGLRTRVIILDHITSPTAVIFPIRELVSLCRRAGATVLIDGAHAPGMLPLDTPSIGADWYVGNCHEWLMAPKGSAFLWTDVKRQAETHPLSILHGYRKGYTIRLDRHPRSEHVALRAGGNRFLRADRWRLAT